MRNLQDERKASRLTLHSTFSPCHLQTSQLHCLDQCFECRKTSSCGVLSQATPTKVQTESGPGYRTVTGY